MRKIEYIIIFILVVGVTSIIFHDIKSSKQISTYELQQKALRLEIEQYRLRESKKEKQIEYLMTQYNQAKDSLDIERKTVHVQYIRYKEPVKVDLSTDAKRDSVIDKIIN